MRGKGLVALLLVIASGANAELQIEPSSDNPRLEAMRKKHASATQPHPAQATRFPSLGELNASVAMAKLRSAALARSVEVASASRPAILKLNCSLANEAPSGVERKAGGLNGVMSVYSCGPSYVVTYENNYDQPLTQRVKVYDDDFAGRSAHDVPLIKVSQRTSQGTRLTRLRWLNPSNEISYEVYTDLSKASDSLLEDQLKAALNTTALALTTSDHSRQ